MNLLRRHPYLVTGALALAGLIALGFRPRPVAVDIEAVARGPLRETVEEEGRTRVVDRYVVSAPVPGYLRRVVLEVGDAVAAGQVLAQLEPLRADTLDPRRRAESEARVAAARAAVEAARQRAEAAAADADYAAAEQRRLEALVAQHMVSEDAFQLAAAAARRTASALQSARFQVEVARADLRTAEAALAHSASAAGTGEHVAITAPVAGRVLKRFHESEGVVQSGEPVLEIGDPGSLEVEVDVLSRDAVRIAPGMAMELERWGGATPLSARVRTVEPVGFTKISALGVEEQRVLVIADITAPPEQWQRLGDGYRVEAVFVLWQGRDVLQVPSSALFRRDGGWAVFVVEGGRARQRQVTIGHEGDINVEVTGGLAAGTRIIAHPGDAVAEGVRVQDY